MKTLLIDNFDSFTFNLEHYLRNSGSEVVTYRNDAGLSVVENANPDLIVLSPGPSSPQNAGMCMDLVREFKGKYPIFGVCLGMQVIAEVFGTKIGRLDEAFYGEDAHTDAIYAAEEYNRQLGFEAVLHGGASSIKHDGKTIYEGLPNPFAAGRYHSLGARVDAVKEPLQVSACVPFAHEKDFPAIFGSYFSGIAMGVRHREYKIEGVQFHPESVLTMHDNAGLRLIENVVKCMRQ